MKTAPTIVECETCQGKGKHILLWDAENKALVKCPNSEEIASPKEEK